MAKIAALTRHDHPEADPATSPAGTMVIKRLKKVVGFALDRVLLDQIDAWRLAQDVPPSRTAVLEAAIREFLKQRKGLSE